MSKLEYKKREDKKYKLQRIYNPLQIIEEDNSEEEQSAKSYINIYSSSFIKKL